MSYINAVGMTDIVTVEFIPPDINVIGMHDMVTVDFIAPDIPQD
ncbi:MAG: hypothetical protein WAT91_03175 [Saprospiraceae bacterium]